jgi:uncharacterized membrane protein YkoI
LRASTRNAKTLLIAVVAVTVLLIGAGVAYATSSTDDSTEHSTGPGMEKAKSVALEHMNGRVTATEFQDEEGYYQIEVTKDDGTQVDVNLDKNFNVISTPSDNEGQDGNGAANHGGG